MEDTYENRALFLIMWHGAPGHQTREMFPNWSKELEKIKTNSVEETLWLRNFAMKAIEMKRA